MEPKERMKIPRQKMPEQDPRVRVRNFEEVPLGYDPETAKLEANRCLACKKPKCIAGCPVGVKIPEFVQLVADGEFAAAARKIKETNALPAVCGRVCPQESQCEEVCIVGKKKDPVAIGRLERFVADYEREHDLMELPEKAPPIGKKVAIIGAGPSGLTVAGDLIKLGYEVTIFEALHKPGGVLIYGIPEFRLPKSIVESEVDYLVKQGVELKLSTVIGASRTLKELFEKDGYSAVYIGVGAGLPVFMKIPGEDLSNVYSANEYLTRVNLMKSYMYPQHFTPIAYGRKVTVVGGGNVAMDSARCAMRTGAESVTIVYRRAREQMPCREEEIHHAEDPPRRRGGDRAQAAEESGRAHRRRERSRQGDEMHRDGAWGARRVRQIGAGANPLLTSTLPELELNKWSYIVADDKGRTSLRSVWAGGDIVTGAATVIEAMGAGRIVASDIHKWLSGEDTDWKAIPSPETEEKS
jgi:glutamate synthase (NADPH/NADH) small chain